MTDNVHPREIDDDVRSGGIDTVQPKIIPQYRRDIVPKNVSWSAQDLADFCDLLCQANERAKEIEFSQIDLGNFDSEGDARQKLNEFVALSYEYTATNGDVVEGRGVPDVETRSFPEALKSFYVSNSSYLRRVANTAPLNAVDVFLHFERPSLKIDLLSLPSNPTENRSAINVYGRNEDWVISTADRIRTFLEQRKTFRPLIHGSGTYDYFLYLFYLPLVLWFFVKVDESATGWIESKSIFINVIFAVYALLLSALTARFLFQYLRWLFHPVEYYKESKWPIYAHRSVFGVVALPLFLSALYDIVKSTLLHFF